MCSASCTPAPRAQPAPSWGDPASASPASWQSSPSCSLPEGTRIWVGVWCLLRPWSCQKVQSGDCLPRTAPIKVLPEMKCRELRRSGNLSLSSAGHTCTHAHQRKRVPVIRAWRRGPVCLSSRCRPRLCMAQTVAPRRSSGQSVRGRKQDVCSLSFATSSAHVAAPGGVSLAGSPSPACCLPPSCPWLCPTSSQTDEKSTDVSKLLLNCSWPSNEGPVC